MYKSTTLIKICGITKTQQALEIASLGINAIGVIAVKESPRFVSRDIRREIFENLKNFYPNVNRVTVIKDMNIDFIENNLIKDTNEDVIQIHGDEDLEFCKKFKKKFPNIKLWKAFRIKDECDLANIKNYAGYVDSILLDSWNINTYGGSGIRIKDNILKKINIKEQWWLAGGVSINWIKEILEEIKPCGLDISSSIEVSPGIKDINKTKAIIKEINK